MRKAILFATMFFFAVTAQSQVTTKKQITTDNYTQTQFTSDIAVAKNKKAPSVVETTEDNKTETYIVATGYGESGFSYSGAVNDAKKRCPEQLMYQFIWPFITTKYPVVEKNPLTDVTIQNKYTYTGAGVTVTVNHDYSNHDAPHEPSANGSYEATTTCKIKLTDITIPADGIIAAFTIK